VAVAFPPPPPPPCVAVADGVAVGADDTLPDAVGDAVSVAVGVVLSAGMLGVGDGVDDGVGDVVELADGDGVGDGEGDQRATRATGVVNPPASMKPLALADIAFTGPPDSVLDGPNVASCHAPSAMCANVGDAVPSTVENSPPITACEATAAIARTAPSRLPTRPHVLLLAWKEAKNAFPPSPLMAVNVPPTRNRPA
jgi:hypothetical protein